MPTMKWWLVALLVAVAPALAAAQAAQPNDLDKAPRISQAEFKKLHDAGQVLVLDVRDADSYRAGHIPGAISIPLDQLASHVDELKRSSKPIVTYCA